jgi:hypothetical protein
MDTKLKLIRLQDRRNKPKRSTEERSVDSRFERIVDVIDELQERIEVLEERQLKLVRALNELLSRLETDNE